MIKFVIVSVLLVIVSYVVNSNVPFPYMDEVFHIPQAQRYCINDYTTWDPKITTLPGLYIIAAGYSNIVQLLKLTSSPLDWCTTNTLRGINTIFGVLNYFIIYYLLLIIHKGNNHNNGPIYARTLHLSFFPVLFFFNFLFYTDNGSLFFVLLMLYLSLKNRHLFAAMAGAMSVLFRQTNIIWVLFTAANCAVTKYYRKRKEKDDMSFGVEILGFLKFCATDSLSLIRLLWGYVLILVGFVTFVVTNGGITVGDKENHTSITHLSQMLYFALFTCALHGPTLLQLKLHPLSMAFKRDVDGNPLWVLLATVTVLLIVRYFTYAHPFLLADNRHYTFYLWKNFFRSNPYVAYLLTPAYMYSFWAIWKLLDKKPRMWRVIFLVCVAGVLVPSPLIEFRYFIVPYILFGLHVPPQQRRTATFTETTLFVVVNVVTLYVFTCRPFTAPDGSVGRFMW